MKSIFPVTYSTLCPLALAAFISEKYPFGNVQCKFLVRGVGDTYLVISPKSRFILRIYRTTHDQFYTFSQPVHLKSYTGILRHIINAYWDEL